MVLDPATIGRRFFEEQDRLRGALPENLIASGYQAHLGNQPPLDSAGHSRFSAAFYAAFPDLEHTIQQVIAHETSVAVRFRLAGTHSGDFMGVPASGRSVDIGAIAIMTVTDGAVQTLHGQFDQWALMEQIGALAER